MNCHEARSELDALLPREQPREELRVHLADCAACRADAARLASVDARLTGLFGRLAPRPEFEARLRAAIARVETTRPAAQADRIAAADPEPTRRLLRAESILDGVAAVGIGATVLGLTLHSQATLERWLEFAMSGLAGALATSGTLLIGGVTIGVVGVIGAGAARWSRSR